MKSGEAALTGIRSGLPIALGYIPIAITYGLIARSQGMPLWFTLLLSLIVFAGSSQFIALQLLAAGAGFFEVILTTFAVNFRNFLMASAVSLRVPEGSPVGKKLLTGLMVTDETFAIISARPEPKLPFGFIIGLQGLLYLAWNGGSLLGATLVGDLGALWNNSLGIAIYAMFISLVIPIVRSSRPLALTGAVTAVLSVSLSYSGLKQMLGSSAVLLISAVLGAAFGAWYLGRKEASRE